MDGLECSEIVLSKLNKEFRIDSEYYQKLFLADDIFLKSKGATPINCFVTDGQHGYHELDDNSSIHMLTAKNTKNWFADTVGADLIAKWVDDNNKRSSLQENDLILSTRGSVGYCAIVKSDVLPANIDQDVARIEILDSNVCPEYLLTYLNSRFGQDWMKRNQTGMVQQGLSLQKVREIPVPLFSKQIQRKIAYIINFVYDIKAESFQKMEIAKKLIEDIINVPLEYKEKDNISIKTIGESFLISDRLDAEYYQPIYENIENQIDCTNTIITSCEIRDENFTPKENELYQYIELANVDSMGGISTVDKIYGKELPSRARRLVKTGQVIISSVEGSLQSCALITEEFNNALCSTGFYVLDSEKYNSETLLVLFKSEAIQALLKKRCSGTILTAISKEEFEKMPLPEVDRITQNAIKEKVQESFRLRRKSKELLDIAIKAVEMAIETDEQTALAWLGTQNV